MLLAIESPSSYRTKVYYRLAFESRVEPGRVVRFRCDREGRVESSDLARRTWKLFEQCRAGRDWLPAWVEEVHRSVFRRGIGQCECGSQVVLGGPANRCRCGLRYDLQGNPTESVASRRRPA